MFWVFGLSVSSPPFLQLGWIFEFKYGDLVRDGLTIIDLAWLDTYNSESFSACFLAFWTGSATFVGRAGFPESGLATYGF